MARNGTRIGVAALVSVLSVAGAAGQGFVLVGGELGLGYRGASDEVETFIGSYNRVNAASLAEPMDDIGGVPSLAWNARVHVALLPLVMVISLGAGGYEAESSAELMDGGGRTLRVEVDDFVAGLDLAWGRTVGRNLVHVGPSLIARVRETTVTGTRRFADGSSDAGDPTPASPLSGEFTAAVAQFHVGGVLGAQHRLLGRWVLTLRAGATYPVGERAITRGAALERIDDLHYPVDVERLQAEGNVTTAANAMQSGMDALELELMVGLSYGFGM